MYACVCVCVCVCMCGDDNYTHYIYTYTLSLFTFTFLLFFFSIGKYKLVLFAQCSRILWPIKAGNLRNNDRSGLNQNEYNFLFTYHNLSDHYQSKEWLSQWSTYPQIDTTISSRIKTF